MKRTFLKKHLLILFALIAAGMTATAQQKSITGKWKTIDDEDNTAKSEVQIWKENGKYYGKIVKIYNPDNRDSRCTECDSDDTRYNKKILGMTIINDMEKTENNLWEEGEILDPNNGSVYSCKMWLADDGNLMVRGFLGFSMLGRSQKWIKVE
ncbi:MAG: DUF2147 domain-containing protein [Bacteroidota bacterium]